MKKTQLTVAQLAAAVVGFYIFDKFGGVTAVKRIMPPVWPIPPPVTETGYMTQAEWEAAGYGHGMADYEDWLRGQ